MLPEKPITDKANKLGFDTAGAYLKSQILKSLESVNKKPISVEGEMLPVNPPVNKRYKKPPQGKELDNRDKMELGMRLWEEGNKIPERKPPQPKWLK